MNELIPYDKLEDGFNRVKDQVESLINCSRLSLQQHEYTISVGLSVLAYEEIYKMQRFLFGLTDGTGIGEDEWNEITKGDRKTRKSAHVIKAERSYLDKKKQIQTKGYDEHLVMESIMSKLYENYMYRSYSEKTRIDPLVIERLRTFSSIKNSCFYLGWENNDWTIFTKVSKPEKKALAEFLLWLDELFYYNTILDKNHPRITDDENAEDFIAYKNDPLSIKAEQLEKQLKTKEFKKTVMLATKIIDKFRLDSRVPVT